MLEYLLLCGYLSSTYQPQIALYYHHELENGLSEWFWIVSIYNRVGGDAW